MQAVRRTTKASIRIHRTAPQSITVADRIRARSRESLQSLMRSFLTGCSPKEAYLLRNILVNWESERTPEGSDLALAKAFTREITNRSDKAF